MSDSKTGAYAHEIQDILDELFRGVTPFVQVEPLRGFADYVVYINNGTLTPWIRQALYRAEKSIDCRYCFKGQAQCSREDNGKNCAPQACKYWTELQRRRSQIQRSLQEGIHLFEIKSDHDSISRFGDQLPHYCLFGDYVWLVFEGAQPPKWVPRFVGLMRYANSQIHCERKAQKINRFPHLDKRIIRAAREDVRCIQNCQVWIKFLRSWFINSIFHEEDKRPIIEMPHLDQLILLHEHIRRTSFLCPTTLNDFTEKINQDLRQGNF
jgi:hypothetical protein